MKVCNTPITSHLQQRSPEFSPRSPQIPVVDDLILRQRAMVGNTISMFVFVFRFLYDDVRSDYPWQQRDGL